VTGLAMDVLASNIDVPRPSTLDTPRAAMGIRRHCPLGEPASWVRAFSKGRFGRFPSDTPSHLPPAFLHGGLGRFPGDTPSRFGLPKREGVPDGNRPTPLCCVFASRGGRFYSMFFV